MNRPIKGTAVTLLLISLTGCGLFGGDEPTVIVEPAPLPPEVIEEESELEVPPPPAPTAALTRPTDPSERVRVIQSGRSDPFSAFLPPASPPAPPSPPTTQQPSPPSAPSTPAPSPAPGPTVTRPLDPSPSTPGQPGSPPSAPGELVLPELPQPQPQLALQVQVSGITALGGSSHAILLAPGENVTRTVRPGDRLSGNQVLVRAIDLSNRAEPVVILEEAGMRVAAAVGRNPEIISSAAVPGIAPIPALYSAHTQP